MFTHRKGKRKSATNKVGTYFLYALPKHNAEKGVSLQLPSFAIQKSKSNS
jgi:hypothetical protein